MNNSTLWLYLLKFTVWVGLMSQMFNELFSRTDCRDISELIAKGTCRLAGQNDRGYYDWQGKMTL